MQKKKITEADMETDGQTDGQDETHMTYPSGYPNFIWKISWPST